MSFAQDCVYRLLHRGRVTAIGEDVFVGTRANTPAQPTKPFVVVIATSGAGGDYIQNQDEPYLRHPSAQVVVKYKSDAKSAFALAEQAWKDLVSVHNESIPSGAFYLDIKALNEPFDGGPDDRGLAQVKFNVIGRQRN